MIIRNVISEAVNQHFNEKSGELKQYCNTMKNECQRTIDIKNYKVIWQYYRPHFSNDSIDASIVSTCLYFNDTPTKLDIEIKNNSEEIVDKCNIIVYCVKEESDITCKAGVNDGIIEPNKTIKIPCLVNKENLVKRDIYSIKLRLAVYNREKKKVVDLKESKSIQIKIDEVEACIEEMHQMFKFRDRFSFKTMEEVLKRNAFNIERTCQELLR